MASLFVKFNCFSFALGKGIHHLHAAGDTIKVYLTNVTPIVATHTKKIDLGSIVEENGFLAANIQNDYITLAGVSTLTGVDVTWVAALGSFGPFRYAALYNETAPDKDLIAYYDYGSNITVLDGEVFKVDFGTAILTVT